jgi:predicted NBD/HSP70 family sugar kinase
MILCVDVGGTKTLLGLGERDSNSEVQINSIEKIQTPKDVQEFFDILVEKIKHFNPTTLSIAFPGSVDQKTMTLIGCGNLDWKNVKVKDEIEKRIEKAPTILFENDAALAALAEANEAGREFDSVYYVTLSTGIGGGLVYQGQLVESIKNSEPGHMPVAFGDYKGIWEKLSSGKALMETHGKMAKDIPEGDPIWDEYAKGLAIGFLQINAMVSPECIVIGGSVGSHFEKYINQLVNEFNENVSPILPVPKILKAAHPEEAVIRGCYYYAEQNS